MSRSTRSQRPPRSMTIRQTVGFTVRRAPFRTLESLERLDVQRLERAARARFEVGWFESGCCRRMVHAIVEKGRVTRLEIEPCPAPEKLGPEWRAAVQAARKALARQTPGKHHLPVRVDQFLARAEQLTIEVYGCFTICAFGYCLECCFGLDDPALNRCRLHAETTKLER